MANLMEGTLKLTGCTQAVRHYIEQEFRKVSNSGDTLLPLTFTEESGCLTVTNETGYYMERSNLILDELTTIELSPTGTPCEVTLPIYCKWEIDVDGFIATRTSRQGVTYELTLELTGEESGLGIYQHIVIKNGAVVLNEYKDH